MKKFIIFCTLIFCTAAVARTINWYVDGSVYQTTTCNSGDGITPPTPPAKYGYTFQRWAVYYTPIEYIESTGQYINTEVFLEPDAEIETKFRVVEAPATSDQWTVIYQSRDSSDNLPNVRDIACSRNGRFLTNNDSGIATPSAPIYTVGVDYTEHMTPSGWTINDVYYAKPGAKRTITTPATLLLLRTTGIVRLYYFKIWNNNTLVRYFIPVLDLNGVACMFDKVSQQFFYNAGTGNFIAGPVVNE